MSPDLSMGLTSTVSREWDQAHAFAIRLATGKGFLRLARFNHSAWHFNNVPADLDRELDAPEGSRVYFESWYRKNPETGKNGVQGPIHWSNLAEWKAEKPKKRDFLSIDLPYPPYVCREVYKAAKGMVGNVGYAKLQLWHNLKRSVFGLGSIPWLRSPDRMTCSEFAAFLWWLAEWHDGDVYYDLGALTEFLEIGVRNILDDVAPAGQIGLYEAVRAFMDARALRIAENKRALSGTA